MKKKGSGTEVPVENNSSVYQHIFLLSHMRANTSLIGHILGSHPQICGYYEMHLSYLTENDLVKQEQLLIDKKESNKTLKKDTCKNSCHYLFDKILHNDYELVLENLVPEQIPTSGYNRFRILVSIRPPEQTIKSIVNLFRNKKTDHPYANTEEATEYYLKRIIKLADFCEKNKENYYYYDADLIRTDAEKSLTRIQNWLSLTTPLSEEYQIFSLTGKPRIGDSSDNMKKGRIVKNPTNYNAIEIPSHLLDKAVIETSKYRQQIISHAIDSIIF